MSNEKPMSKEDEEAEERKKEFDNLKRLRKEAEEWPDYLPEDKERWEKEESDDDSSIEDIFANEPKKEKKEQISYVREDVEAYISNAKFGNVNF